MQTLISQLLMEKGREVLTIAPAATVFEAVKLMDEKNVGSLVVLNSRGRIAGIFVERDALQRVLLAGKSAKTEPVQAVMTRKVVCALPEMTIDQCLALMTDKQVRHLPVIDKEQKLVGLVSMGDLVKFISSEQIAMIRNLENYIEGVL
ncbi:MAG: CBS domain-containing protein [Lentisphaerae bacterium]|nr:CBS domain-containing protein [Lentisphaerota bacterium]